MDEDRGGIWCEERMSIQMVLINGDSNEMGKGICGNWNLVACVDDSPLRKSNMGSTSWSVQRE